MHNREPPTIGHAVAERFVGDLDDEAWRQDRRDHPSIGASAMAAVLGLGAYGSEWQVWAEVARGHERLTTDEMKLGRLLEPRIRQLASERLGWAIREVPWVLRHPDVPCMTTNLDGYVPGLSEADGQVVELKLTAWRNRGDWEVLKDSGDPRTVVGTSVGGYWVQVQDQLSVTGLGSGWLVGLVDDNGAGMRALAGLPVADRDLIDIYIERDDGFIARMEAEAQAWWSQYVLNDRPPPLNERDWEEVRRFFASTYEPEHVELPGLADELYEYQDYRQAEKEAKMQKQACAARIIAAMGGAQTATIAGQLVTWKRTRSGKRVLRVP